VASLLSAAGSRSLAERFPYRWFHRSTPVDLRAVRGTRNDKPRPRLHVPCRPAKQQGIGRHLPAAVWFGSSSLQSFRPKRASSTEAPRPEVFRYLLQVRPRGLVGDREFRPPCPGAKPPVSNAAGVSGSVARRRTARDRPETARRWIPSPARLPGSVRRVVLQLERFRARFEVQLDLWTSGQGVRPSASLSCHGDLRAVERRRARVGHGSGRTSSATDRSVSWLPSQNLVRADVFSRVFLEEFQVRSRPQARSRAHQVSSQERPAHDFFSSSPPPLGVRECAARACFPAAHRVTWIHPGFSRTGTRAELEHAPTAATVRNACANRISGRGTGQFIGLSGSPGRGLRTRAFLVQLPSSPVASPGTCRSAVPVSCRRPRTAPAL